MSTGQINLNIGAEIVTGPRGLSIKNVVLKEVLPNKDNVYNVILENNSIIGELLIRKGDKGDTGSQGIQGISGVGISNITSIKTELTNQITIHLTNGENKILNVLDGENAYELWLGEENEGTLNDFLEAYRGFKGEKGDKGNTGAQGIQGERGLTGAQGTQGPKGNTGERGPQGFQGKNLEFIWRGTELGVRVQGQTQYQYVDLFGGSDDLLNKKQDKNDSTLITTNKTIVGGINEIANKLNKICAYRIGDILTTENKEHPALTWQGTTWKKIEAAFLRGAETGQEAGIIGGSNTVTLKIGNLPAHNHPISVILGNSGVHRHKVDNHIHTKLPHTHSLRIDQVDDFNWGLEGANVGSDNSLRSRHINSHIGSAGGENTGGATPFTDNQGNHNHTVTASSSNIGNGEAINILPRYYTVHYWKRVS